MSVSEGRKCEEAPHPRVGRSPELLQPSWLLRVPCAGFSCSVSLLNVRWWLLVAVSSSSDRAVRGGWEVREAAHCNGVPVQFFSWCWEEAAGELHVCPVTQPVQAAHGVSDGTATDNPVFLGFCNLAVKIRVLLKFGTALSQIGSSLSGFFFHLFTLF